AAILGDGKYQSILDDGEFELVGTSLAPIERESIALQDVEHRHLALMLDVGAAAPDRGLVEGNGDEPLLGVGVELGWLEHDAALTACGRCGEGWGRSDDGPRAPRRARASWRQGPGLQEQPG